jgi:hypothetical protein
MSRLPSPLPQTNDGTNLYGDVNNSNNRQVLLNKMLTGGKKGGAPPIQGSILVPNHNASPKTIEIQTNLAKISNQGGADRALDKNVHKGGGQRKKSKKLRKSRKRKRRNTRKKSRK